MSTESLFDFVVDVVISVVAFLMTIIELTYRVVRAIRYPGVKSYELLGDTSRNKRLDDTAVRGVYHTDSDKS